MAKEKRIIIPGENLLSSLTDDWGGENNTGEAITKYGTEIPDGYKWGVNFGELERFLKQQLGANTALIDAVSAGKIGCLRTYEDEDEELHLVGFATLADYEDWLENPEQVTPITDIIIPKGSGEGSGYAMILDLTQPVSVQADSNFNVVMTATSAYTTGGITQYIDEPVTLTIQTSANGTTWSNRGNVVIQSNTETSVPMNGLLPAGNIYVRITAAGFYATSIAAVFQVNIVDLELSWATTENAVQRNTGDEVLELVFNITGAVHKYLYVEFDGNSQKRKYVSLANTTTGTAYTMVINPSEVSGILGAGRHTVRAWLEYVEDGITIMSNEVNSEYVVSDGTTVAIAINDIAEEVNNFSAVNFFDWFVNSDIMVVFTLQDAFTNERYGQWSMNAVPHSLYGLTAQIGIEGAADSVIHAVMLVEDENGNTLHPSIPFEIGNNADFAPVSGPTFVLAPSSHNNEDNPDTIINPVSDVAVSSPSDFDGFDFKSDGWIVADYKGTPARVLRVSAGRSLVIHFNPFSRHTAAPSYNSMTFEVDFVTDNIIDTEIPIITIGTERKGLTIYPDHAVLRTEYLTLDEQQNVAWAEGVRTHLAVTVDYGSSYSYVRIYVNGVLDREFSYSPLTDTFASGDAVITIGNDSTDIDIFGMRCYNDALTSRQVTQDYKAMMSTVDEKIAFAEKNDILDAIGNITWEKCLGKYNVIGHTGRLPSFTTGKITQTGIDLEIVFAEGEDGNSIIMKNLENKGQGTTAMNYYWWNQQYKIISGKSNSDENTHFYDLEGNELQQSGYAIKEGEPLAKKLVGKVNFASSMQSHKLGLTWAFTEIYKQMVKTGKMSAPSQFSDDSASRLAVFERPFLFFQRESESDPYVFRNLMTFGAGKGDKPTFGYNKKKHMFMVEGADNDVQLAVFNMPWDDDYIEYNASQEAWCYKGTDTKNINFGFGKTDDEDIPDDSVALQKIKDFFNFVYEHSTRIEYGGATLSALTWSGDYESKQQWVNSGDVYRWDVGKAMWVSAGINILTQYSALTDGETLDLSNTTKATSDLIDARVAHFKAHASEYFHVRDALYHYCFIKLFAGTDNRAKNTYYYTDPEDLKIRWMQDDLDTVIKTNNSGQQTKPYWVEEHTKDGIKNYWNGENSVFNLLLEAAYDHDVIPAGESFTIQSVMRNMLDAMVQLGGSLIGFMEKYLLSTQDYFPAAAYNSQAQWVYEYAHEHHQNPNVAPLTQSCGSQRWSEYQWLVDRIMFISSWCRYGEFAAGGLGWRGVRFNREFDLTPAKWMYPRIMQGSSIVGGTALTRPGDEFTTVEIQTGDETQVVILGNNYLWYLGDMDVTSDNAEFTFSGKRLRAITVNEGGTKTSEQLLWNISKVKVNATNIERFAIVNADVLSGEIDLSQCVRLRKIDLRGTSVTSVILPQTGLLTSLSLPESVASLVIDGQKNIGNTSLDEGAGLVLEGVTSLTSIKVVGNQYLSASTGFRDYLLDAINGGNLESLVLDNLNLSIDASIFSKILDIETLDLKGTITVTGSFDFALNLKLIKKLPNVYAADSGLQIIAGTPVALSSIQVGGERYIDMTGEYQYDIIPNDYRANAFTELEFSLTGASGKASIDPTTGMLTVNALNSAGDTSKISIVARVKRSGQADIDSQPYEVGLYHRDAEAGDLVFADGSFSDLNNPAKTVVGVCFYVNGSERRMVALTNLYTHGIGDASYIRSYRYCPIGLDRALFTGAIYDNPLIANGVSNIEDVAQVGNVTIEGLLPYNGMYGYTTNDTLPVGMVKTLKWIFLRDYNLAKIRESSQGFDWPYPSAGVVVDGVAKATELDSVWALRDKAGSVGGLDYKMVYYVAPSVCFAYVPSGVSADDERFGAHHWWLPTSAELLVLRDCVNNGVFQPAIDAGLFTQLSHNNLTGSNRYYYYWSCDEYDQDDSYSVCFSEATVAFGQTKSYNQCVRAVCKF